MLTPIIQNELRSVAISTFTNKSIFCFRFISIVSAESQFYISFNAGDQVQLKSAKVQTYFLLFNNSEFVGGVPSLTENNSLFEMIDVGFSMIALRVVNPMNSQQGGTGASATEETDTDMANTEEPAVSECYLGFDSGVGRPGCYDSADNIATKFLWIPL